MANLFVARSFYKLLLLGAWLCCVVTILTAVLRIVGQLSLVTQLTGSARVVQPGAFVQTMPLPLSAALEIVFQTGKVFVCVAVLFFVPKVMQRLFPEVNT